MVEGASGQRTAPVDAEAAHETAAAPVALPDRWRLLELLGTGGQGAVWLAEDRTLGQRVALKILPENADERTRGRWLEEVRQGRRLSHPKLIRIFDVVETSDRPVAVMEFVPGGTLADRVVSDGAQPVDHVIRWAGDALDVLAYLHENRIVHRDVKPSNLLVNEDGSLKLSDLGLVRRLDRSSDLTRTLEGVGTPRFMAPEQLRGEEPTPACDLYSLGVTMYQLLTGRLPFEGDSAFQVADGHLHLRPAGVREIRPECPRWLARFVEKLLEKNPGERFRSADRASTALQRQRVGLSRRTLGGMAAAIVIAVAVGFGVGYSRSLMEPALDRVEIAGEEVVVRSETGRMLWKATRPDSRPQAFMADVVGGAGPEVVVAWSSRHPAEDPDASAVFDVHNTAGEVIRSIKTGGWGNVWFPEFDPVWHVAAVTAGDLTGDGDDVVWGLTNPRWYPSIVGVTSVRDTTERPVVQLANSGHLQTMVVVDIDGNGLDDVAAIMINNRLGYQRVLITMSARSRVTGEACTGMVSPDLASFRQGRIQVPTGCLTYTPLGSNVLVVDPPRVVENGIELVLDGEVRVFDGWGNPETSPLCGSGGQAREAFWNDLASDCSKLRLAAEVSPPYSLEGLRRTHPEVMSERPSEVAAVLAVSRSLASGGHLDNSIRVLRNAVERFPDERDLQLRLGEHLLIDGQHESGRSWVARSVTVATSGRNHNDQAYMLILDASIRGDRLAYEETRRFLANLALTTKVAELDYLDVAWFFFQGQWGDPRLVDADPGNVHHWVRVVQEWARFETYGDVERAPNGVRRFADIIEVRQLARVLEARVHLADGDAVGASRLADESAQELRASCRTDFQACVWLPLAEWVSGQALGRIEGRETEARALLERAAGHAPGTWIATSLTQ